MNGYAGKILRLDLTERKVSTIATGDYQEWGGGHGMGSAIFFDLVKDKTIAGFDPANVVTIMTSPLCGTLVPAAGGRTEVQGIGVQSYPIGWFTRSNFGGRFSAMLKYAGWDGIVIEGRADEPVWIDVRDEDVQIRDCAELSLWGTDTWECQQSIWRYVTGEESYGDWFEPRGQDGGLTTQRPAVLAIGPAGENLSRVACLIHDASNGAGQGGFGAVFGSKNLKAVSVIGTGYVEIADPKALLATRLRHKEDYAFDLAELKATSASFQFHSPPVPVALWEKGRPRIDQRPQACLGCHSGCRARYKDAVGNEASCFTSVFYWDARSLDIQRAASDLINRYGLNAVDMCWGLMYIRILQQDGQLNTAKIPDCPLDFTKYGSQEFVEQFVRMVAYGNDGKGNDDQFGADISDGFVRAAEKWGRREQDLASGILAFPYWGLPIHKEPRAQVYWAYGTLLGDRDINEHGYDWLKYVDNEDVHFVVKTITDKMVPFQGDMDMLDFSESNIYSEHMAKLVSWQRYYTRFWKQSMLFCDARWPDFVNVHRPDYVGATGLVEPEYMNAVTGQELSFEDGIILGRKIWNLDHAIWTLQGRHRDMVHFADNIYEQWPLFSVDDGIPNVRMPGKEDGVWGVYGYSSRTLDRDKFEEFKTLFYEMQGWDTATGYPTRSTMESLGLGYVADELEEHGKLGGT
ncbi:MAG TPA: aldehyde ferredoxin oxidoreductase N-terminal domain-containing protein [Anaerolineae bacterium]|nr:aldehyde ferredoxin oxidoreductase N-terminal domain-containing protein [Anaerolineae bacterium]